MTVALRMPRLVRAVISVDNAPVNATLQSEFSKYIEGMRKIESANIEKLKDADNLLKPFEEVRTGTSPLYMSPLWPITECIVF